MVGRDAEFARLGELIARAASGAGAIVYVEGPAGIGKSALLAETARLAGDGGFRVLSAIAAELERDYAFGLTRQLFAPVLSQPGARDGLLQGAAQLAEVPLGLVSDPGPGDKPAIPPDVWSAMHGLYWLTVKLTEHAPLLLVLDDVHWGDTMSLRFILYLARRLEGLPALLLLAGRPPGEHFDPIVLAQLEAMTTIEVLNPEPLTPGQTADLIAGRGFVDDLDADFLEACHFASGGNPFLLGQLVARMRADGVTGTVGDAAWVARNAPEGVVRWVGWRLLSLGAAARELASAYAVLDAGASLADAAVLVAMDASTAAAAADALIGADILTPSRPYEFVHPLVRAAIYDALTPARRAESHARAARLAAQRGEPAALVAAHLLASDPGSDEWTLEMLRRAARDALATGAPTSAATYLERALREAMPRSLRARLLVELGGAQLHTALPDGLRAMRMALELEEEALRRAAIHLSIGRALFANGDTAAARGAFLAGLDEAGGGDDDLVLELSAWSVIGTRYDLAAVKPSAQARLQQVFDGTMNGQTRMERLLLAFFAFTWARNGERRAEVVAEFAKRALADGKLLEDCAVDVAPYGAACSALVSAGQLGVAITELNRAVLASQRRGSRQAVSWFCYLRGIARYAAGNIFEAIADLEDAYIASAEVSGSVAPDLRGYLAVALVERGDLAGAEEALAITSDKAARAMTDGQSVPYHFGLGRLRAARGTLPAALEAFLACETPIHAMNATNPAAHLPWRNEAAVAALRLGDRSRARELLADAVIRARAFEAPGALGQALRAAGMIEGGEYGIGLLGEAAARLDGSGCELQLARTLTELGAALRRTGRRSEALEPLRRGLDIATRCGGLLVASRAREELVAAGGRPRRERIRGVDSLTASELRVARMAAVGETNSQIAQDLSVTRRTVETHLTSIYRKLDVNGREQLAQALERDAALV